MARLLAYNAPATGHVFPCTGMLLELERRGHEVHVVTMSSVVDRLRDVGLRATPVDHGIEAIELDDWQGRNAIDALERLQRGSPTRPRGDPRSACRDRARTPRCAHRRRLQRGSGIRSGSIAVAVGSLQPVSVSVPVEGSAALRTGISPCSGTGSRCATPSQRGCSSASGTATCRRSMRCAGARSPGASPSRRARPSSRSVHPLHRRAVRVSAYRLAAGGAARRTRGVGAGRRPAGLGSGRDRVRSSLSPPPRFDRVTTS